MAAAPARLATLKPAIALAMRLAERLARGLAAVLAALALLLVALPVQAQSFPAFNGLVTDAAGVLPADRKAALERRLEEVQQRTGRQLVVATIPDLQGYAIEDYGYRLGRSWGVGLKGADNGAILIVAPRERKVRIEVGRRLEPVLTDAWSSVIIQQKILPAFKAGDLPGGIAAGAEAIVTQLGLPDDQARAELAKAAATFDRAHARQRNGGGGLPLGILFWLMVVGVLLLAHARRGRGPWAARRYDQGGSNWPIWLWAASEMLGSQRDDDDRRGGGSGWGGGGGDSGGGGSDGSWGGGGFTGGGGGDFGGGGASGSW